MEMLGYSVTTLGIGFAAGLGVGWFVLPRPAWATWTVRKVLSVFN